MNSIMMVDGYDLPFDGVKRKAKKAKKTKARRKGSKAARKAAAHRSASYLCAGSKRFARCKSAIKSARKAKKCKK